MDLLELMKNRYSVREFEEKQIEKEKLDKILEAGRVAPTACNLQPQRILVIREQENKEKLKKCTSFTFDVPTILMVCVEEEKAWTRKKDGKNHGEIDTTIVTTQMMLEAYHLGIGSTWVCSFDPEKIREEFNLPQSYKPVHLLPMGYPKDGYKPNNKHFERLKLSETVFYEKF